MKQDTKRTLSQITIDYLRRHNDIQMETLATQLERRFPQIAGALALKLSAALGLGLMPRPQEGTRWELVPSDPPEQEAEAG